MKIAELIRYRDDRPPEVKLTLKPSDGDDCVGTRVLVEFIGETVLQIPEEKRGEYGGRETLRYTKGQRKLFIKAIPPFFDMTEMGAIRWGWKITEVDDPS
jgi:hypothetical protein